MGKGSKKCVKSSRYVIVIVVKIINVHKNIVVVFMPLDDAYFGWENT